MASNTTLPPELLNEIMPLSLTCANRDGLRARNSQLCKLSLLDRTWQAYAQYHLDDHLRLRSFHFKKLENEHPDRSPSPPANGRTSGALDDDPKNRRNREIANRAIASSSSHKIEGNGQGKEEEEGERGRSLSRRMVHRRSPIVSPGSARERASKVKILQVDQCLDHHRFSVAKRTLGAFVNVEKVYLAGTSEWYSLTALTELPKLESLHLARVYHALPPSSPFHSVRALSISFGLSKHVDWSLLRTSILPSLETLILNPTDWDFASIDSTLFYEGFCEIAPQLKNLLIAGQDHRNEDVEWERMFERLTGLEKLELRTTSHRALTAMRALPNSDLVSLRISKRLKADGEVERMLQGDEGQGIVPATSLRKLRKLTIATDGGGDSWRRTKDSEALAEKDRRSAVKWCAANEVELVWCDEELGPVEDWNPELI